MCVRVFVCAKVCMLYACVVGLFGVFFVIYLFIYFVEIIETGGLRNINIVL